MWERATGILDQGCFRRADALGRNGRGPIRLGDTWQTLLRARGPAAAAQPRVELVREGRRQQARRRRRRADARPDGSQLVGTTARGRRAGSVRIGDSAATARGRAAGAGLRVARDGKRAFVYSVRDGRVRALAVTTAAFGADTNALRSAMSRVLKARASAAERKFVPAEAQAKSRMLGRTLAGSADAKTNAQLALLCNLQL